MTLRFYKTRTPPLPNSQTKHHAYSDRLFSVRAPPQALFQKHSPGDGDGSGAAGKVKLSNIVVECRKEGIVHYLTAESLDSQRDGQKWDKCKLALMKTIGGYMLEFYSPPKSHMVGRTSII